MRQLPVLAVLGEQLFMRAALDDAAVFEDHDGIGEYWQLAHGLKELD